MTPDSFAPAATEYQINLSCLPPQTRQLKIEYLCIPLTRVRIAWVNTRGLGETFK